MGNLIQYLFLVANGSLGNNVLSTYYGVILNYIYIEI